MITSKKNRRQYRRIRLTPLFVEPIQIKIGESGKPIPGIMADLSAAGVSIITYGKLPIGETIKISFKVVGIPTAAIEGEVYKIREQSSTYLVVILFKDLHPEIADHLEKMAMDFEDCETKWTRGDFDFCNEDCAYYKYCSKTVKK